MNLTPLLHLPYSKRVALRISSTLLFAASTALCGTAHAAHGSTTSDTKSDAKAEYQKERAACLSGQSTENRNTCLREAAAAYEEAKHGQLLIGDQENYQRNALQRCKELPSDERDECKHRMEGEGTTNGSVASGGIIREYREIIQQPQQPQQPNSQPMQPAPNTSSTPSYSSPGNSSSNIAPRGQ
jgi:hypothetical protein